MLEKLAIRAAVFEGDEDLIKSPNNKTKFIGVRQLYGKQTPARFVARYKGVKLPGTFKTPEDAARAYKAARDVDTNAKLKQEEKEEANGDSWAKIEADAVADDEAVQLMIDENAELKAENAELKAEIVKGNEHVELGLHMQQEYEITKGFYATLRENNEALVMALGKLTDDSAVKQVIKKNPKLKSLIAEACKPTVGFEDFEEYAELKKKEKAELNRLEAENAELKAENAELKAENAELKKANAFMKEQMVDALYEMHKARKLESYYAKLEEENEANLEKLAEHPMVKQLWAINTALKKENAGLKDLIDAETLRDFIEKGEEEEEEEEENEA